MRYTATIVAAASLATIGAAGNAPVVNNNPIGITYSATIPATNGSTLSGAFLGAAAPDRTGVNIQISLYNLPGTANLSYAIHTGKVKNGDCSTAGGVLDPYGGVTGSQCKSNEAACQIGDLSDKHGPVTITSGGGGTGYFADNYVDDYLSMVPGQEAFFGKGSIVVMDSTGASVACANFINANNAGPKVKSQASAASSAAASASASGKANGSGSGSTSSDNYAARITAAPLIGALGLAAMLL